TSQNRPDDTASRTVELVMIVIEVMSATEPEASAALSFSSFEASGTHWNSKSMPECSLIASMIGPAASGVVGVCSMDIQVRGPADPPEPPEPPELPQAERARPPAAAAGRALRRLLR